MKKTFRAYPQLRVQRLSLRQALKLWNCTLDDILDWWNIPTANILEFYVDPENEGDDVTGIVTKDSRYFIAFGGRDQDLEECSSRSEMIDEISQWSV